MMNWQELAQAVHSTGVGVIWKPIDCLGEKDTLPFFLRADKTCDKVSIFFCALGEIHLIEGTVEGHPSIGALSTQWMPESVMECCTVRFITERVVLDESAELLRVGFFSDWFQINHVLSWLKINSWLSFFLLR